MQGPRTTEKNDDLVNGTGVGTRFFELNIPVRSMYVCYSCQHEIQEHKLFGDLNPRESLRGSTDI